MPERGEWHFVGPNIGTQVLKMFVPNNVSWAKIFGIWVHHNPELFFKDLVLPFAACKSKIPICRKWRNSVFLTLPPCDFFILLGLVALNVCPTQQGLFLPLRRNSVAFSWTFSSSTQPFKGPGVLSGTEPLSSVWLWNFAQILYLISSGRGFSSVGEHLHGMQSPWFNSWHL